MERVLIVGYGNIGKLHLQIARKVLPDAQIYVYRHKMVKEIPEFADGCLFRFDEISKFQPHISVIANPSPLHLEISRLLINLGSRVLIEKPISNSLEGVRELIDESDQKNSEIYVGYNLRFSDSLNIFTQMIMQGAIGELYSIICEVGQNLLTWRPQVDYRSTVSAQKKLGGGVLLELSHELDYLLANFGDIDTVKASLVKQSQLDIDVEDAAHMLFQFFPNKIGNTIIGIVSLDFIRHDSIRRYCAVGSKGSLEWDGINGRVKEFTINSHKWKRIYSQAPTREESYLAQWHEFLEHNKCNRKKLASGIDGLRVLQLIEAIKMSSNLEKSISPILDQIEI